jgi:hypothetical protein
MYGVPRATNDIDIVVSLSLRQLLSLIQLFQRVGFAIESSIAVAAFHNKTMFNVVDFGRGLKVDFIVRKERDFSVAEFDRRETHEVEGMRLTIATPEDVLLAKLEWAKIGESELQIKDAAGILQVQSDSLDKAYIEKWVSILGLETQWKSAQQTAV